MAIRSIKRNYLSNLAYQAFTMLTPLLVTPYVARVLGADGLGMYSFAESIVTYFVLVAALGTNFHGQRQISYVQDDQKKRSVVFWNTVIFRVITTATCLLSYGLILVWSSFSQLYLVFSLSIIAVAFDVTWFFQGMEDFQVIAIRNIVIKLISIIAIFVFVRQTNDLVKYALILCGSTLLGNMSLWLRIPALVSLPELRKIRPFVNARASFTLFLPTIATSIYTVFDKTLLGIIANDPTENGYYAQAIKMSMLALALVTSLGRVMLSRIGHHFANGRLDEIRRYMYRSYRFVWMMGIPLCFGLIGIASGFVPWFFGSGYEKVVPLLWITAFLVLAIGVSNVTGTQYLIPTKQQNLLTRSVIIGAVCSIGLNLLLVPSLLSIGTAIAVVASEVLIGAYQLWIVRKVFSTRAILSSSRNYFLAGSVMLIFLFGWAFFIPSSISGTLFSIVFAFFIYTAVLLAMKDELFLDCGNKLFNIGRKRQ